MPDQILRVVEKTVDLKDLQIQKKRIAYRDEDWPRYISMTASGVSIAYTLVYRMLINPRTRISNLK